MNTTEHDLIMTGHRLDLTEALKAFITEKTSRLVRHDGRIIRIRVELGMELNRESQRLFTARGIIEIDGPVMVVSEKSENAYTAIENMVRKLDRRLRQRHRRRRYKRVHPHAIDLPSDLPKAAVRGRYGDSREPLLVA